MIANEKNYSCLTTDCRQSGAANDFEQDCYYAQKKDDRVFDKFIARRVNKDENDMAFRIDVVRNPIKKDDEKKNKTFDKVWTFKKDDDRQSARRHERRYDAGGGEKQEKDQDFFHDDNACQKKKKSRKRKKNHKAPAG